MFKERNFWILLFSRTTSSMGEWILLFFVFDWAEEKTGSPLLGAFLFGFKMLATFLEVAAGVLADRMDRKLLMILSDFVRAGLLLVLLILPFGNTVLLIGVVFLFTGVGTAYAAASTAIVSQIIKPNNLYLANGFFSASLLSTLAIGPPILSVLLSFLSTKQLLVVIMVMFAASGAILPLVKEHTTVELKARKKFVPEMKEGFTYLRTSAKLKGILPSIFPTALGVAPLIVLVPSLIKNIGLGVDWSSRIYALLGGGLLIGFVIMALIGHRFSIGKIMCGGLLAAGAAVVVLSAASNLLTVLIVTIIAGAGMAMTYPSIMTMLHSMVPDELMGRVSMSIFGLGSAIGFVSSVGFGALAHFFGTRMTLMICGLLILLGAGICYTRMPKAIRDAKVHRLTKLKSSSA